jgi:molybdenum cofactor guanylyltransferase
VEPFAGAVLTGGRSRRMGRDKALLPVDGRPLAARVADALAAAGADPVAAVGGDVAGLAEVGLLVVADDRPGEGPLAGIATALRQVGGGDIVVVLACDLVHAAPEAVAGLVAALVASPAAGVAVPLVDGRLQTLHAAWRRRAAGEIEAALERGDRAVRDVLERVGMVTVEGLDATWFHNANRPEDLPPPAVGHTGGMSQEPVPEIDVAELAARQEQGAFVLDVRQPEEYESGHVPGAVLIPLGDLPARQDEVPADREILVICRTGGRSAIAVQALNGAGYRATNVAGGTLAWIEAGRPVVEGSSAG